MGPISLLREELLNIGPQHDKFLDAQRNHTSNEKSRVIKSHERYHESIRDHLPEECKSVLDIGCGLGITDLCLFEHYGRSDGIHFYLFDKTEFADRLYFGFKDNAGVSNDLEMTKNLLIDYGISPSKLTTIEADKNNLLGLKGIDLVISSIAWGFHFPVSTYLEEVVNLMGENSVLILDLRSNTGGFEDLSKRFHVETIENSLKRTRVSCRKRVPE